MTRRRNVVLITGDQWRWECLSVLGHPCVRTPHLDALAADGVLFRRHYAQATPCAPSRASLYTGLYQHNHRVVANGTPLDRRHTNVALEARKAGYAPALFGYTDTAQDPRDLPPDHAALRKPYSVLPGMDGIVEMGDDFAPWFDDLRAKGYAVPAPGDDPRGIFAPDRGRDGADTGATFAPTYFSAEDSATAFITDEAIKHIDAQGDGSWFVHLSYWSPHPPFVAPEPYNAMVDAADVPPPVRASSPAVEAAMHPWIDYFLNNPLGTDYSVGHEASDNLDISDRDWRQMRATYYGMMAEVDANIGRLIAHLRETDQYDDTLIVFTSDHGEQLGDHWMLAKYGPFDQTFHIPLIVRDPDADCATTRGTVVDDFTENVDIMPTILDWLGRDIPIVCDGLSLRGHLRGAAPADWRREVHSAFDFRDFLDQGETSLTGLTPEQCNMMVIRDTRYKYVHFAAWPPLFFDLDDDPDEFHNRAEDPDYRDRVLDYAQRMLNWRLTHDDRVLANIRITPAGPIT